MALSTHVDIKYDCSKDWDEANDSLIMVWLNHVPHEPIYAMTMGPPVMKQDSVFSFTHSAFIQMLHSCLKHTNSFFQLR